MSIQIMNRISDKGKAFKVLHNWELVLILGIWTKLSQQLFMDQIAQRYAFSKSISLNFKPSDSKVQLTDSSIQ